MLNFSFLSGISGAGAKGVFIGFFALIALAVFLLPDKYIYKGLRNIAWYHNIRLWTAGVLVVLSVIHIIF